MSDDVTPNPSPTTTTTTPTPTKPAKPPRRLRRWLWRLALGAIAARLLLAILLPQLLAFAASWYGVQLSVRSTALSLSGLSLRLEDFVVRDAERPEAPPLLQGHELEFDASLRDLLGGELVIIDAALASARIVVQRAADGTLRLPRCWTAPVATPPPEPPPPASAPTKTAVDFRLPLRIVSARLHDVQWIVEDLGSTAAPAIECAVDVDVREVGHASTPGFVLARVHAPAWFDTAWLQAKLAAGESRLQFDWQLEVQGVAPATLTLPAAAQAALGNPHRVGLSLHGAVTGEARSKQPGEARYSANVRGSVMSDGQPQLGLVAAFGSAEPEDSGTAWRYLVELTARECVQRLRVEGELHHADDETAVRGRLQLGQATLARLEPWLTAAGVHLPNNGLSLDAELEAVIGAATDIHVRNVACSDGSVRLPALHVRDLRHEQGALAIGAIEVQGPELLVQRLANGALQIGGVQFTPPAPLDAPTHTAPTNSPSAATPPAPTTPPAAASPLPSLRLGSLRCTTNRLAFEDATCSPPARLDVREFHVRGDALSLGGAAPPGRLSVELGLRDCIEALRVDAELRTTPDALALAWQLAGTGITGAAARPWLAPLGVTPALQAGELRASGSFEMHHQAGQILVQSDVRDVQLRDGERSLLQIDRVAIDGMRSGAAGLVPGNWLVDKPRIMVQQLPDGVALLGIELRSVAGGPKPPPAAPAATPPPPTATATEAPPQALPVLELRGAQAVLATAAADTPPLAVGIDATFGDAHAIGTDATPFELTTRIDGAVAAATLRGQLSMREHSLDASLHVEGVHGDRLQALLPPGVRCTLTDGAADARLAANFGPGPSSAAVRVTGLRLADRGEELAAVDNLHLAIARADAEVLHVADFALTGVRAGLARSADGFEVPGFLLAASPAARRDAGRAEEASRAPALRVPALAVDGVTMAIDRVTFVDRTADGEPLELRGTLTMPAWDSRPEADEPPPARLHFTASAMPLCREFDADITLQPYELRPAATVVLRANGIDTTAVPRLVPALASTLQGTTTDAEFTATLHTAVDLHRRDAHTFDPRQAFGGELQLEDLALRDRASGEVLAAIRSVDVAARTIDPKTGEVLLRTLDIDDPQLALGRDTEGLRLLGLRLLTPPPASAPPTAAATPAATPASAPAASAEAPEFAIDHVQVRGLRTTLLDATTTPPTLLPIADGEFEARRVSTRALHEARPLTFQLALRGGDVMLEKRVLRSSVFAGLLGSAVSAIGGGEDRHQLEPRPLFDEVDVVGELTLAPPLRGQVRAAVTSFELAALRSLVKQSGVDIADGVFDHAVTIDLHGASGVDLRSSQVFTWLSLSEPPGGPISTYLRLPAPLDTVLFLLRNDDDEHRIPVTLHVPANGLSSGAIVGAVVDALAAVIADAVASAASRTAGVLTGALGLGAGAPAAVTVAVPFAAGDPLPQAGDLAALQAALAADDALEVVLTHALGGGDLARAAELATPPPATIEARVLTLRAARDARVADRCGLAEELLALYAAGRTSEAMATQARLQAHDEALGEIERTLNDALTMLANDTPRAKNRRTAAAAAALGRSRLDAIGARLARDLPGLAAARIVSRPVRAVVAEGFPDGGAVVLSTRRRTAR